MYIYILLRNVENNKKFDQRVLCLNVIYPSNSERFLSFCHHS